MLAAGWLAVSVVRRPRWGRERDETAGDCGRVRLASRKWRGTSNQAALPKQEAKPTSVRRDAVTWPPANPAGCKGQSKPRRAPEQEPDRPTTMRAARSSIALTSELIIYCTPKRATHA